MEKFTVTVSGIGKNSSIEPAQNVSSPIMAQPTVNSKNSQKITKSTYRQRRPTVGKVRDYQYITMDVPIEIPNCPPGLEYLASVDQLLVKQTVEVFEMLTGFETNNRYVIQNSLGQTVFYAVEDTDCCTRNCCGSIRPFGMKIFDGNKKEVMQFKRPLACTGCCFPCCLQSLVVLTPFGHDIGSIKEEWTFCYPHYSVKNRNGETVLRIEGPFCKISCGNDVDFKVLALDGTQIGKVSKQWSGLAREIFTDADNFGISFPIDLDVGMKAVMLGACILIDMMFYEKK